jgi:TRAP-type C4-dicarboxylate transport system permease large subunit
VPYLARTALPFFFVLVFKVLLIFWFPALVSWLPSVM